MTTDSLENLEPADLEAVKLVEEIQKLRAERAELRRPMFLRPGILLGMVTAAAASYGVLWQYSASDLRTLEARVDAKQAKLDQRVAEEKLAEARDLEKVALVQVEAHGNRLAAIKRTIARANSKLQEIEVTSSEQRKRLADISGLLGSVGLVRIKSLLPNPVGDESKNEEVTLINDGTVPIALTGWTLRDRVGTTWTLTGILQPGQEMKFMRNGQPMTLNNGGDTIVLVDPKSEIVDSMTYGRVQQGEIVLGYAPNP